jgi:DNA polymerase-3 subunit alpha
VFAGYGFNKSHSAAYALISYQTAYLKCHYPVEFMAAVLTCEKADIDTMTRYIAEARTMGIEVLRPDVFESESDFSVVTRGGPSEGKEEGAKAIRFGLGAVRNVGGTAVEAIIEARTERPFSGLFDFCERVDAKRVNRRVIESLIKTGAFDAIIEARRLTRARLLAALDAAHERAATAQRDREAGQTSLFAMLDAAAAAAANHSEDLDEQYPDVPEWNPRQRLEFEKESLGFYVSGHPLDRWKDDLRRHASATTANLDQLPERTEVSVGGLATNYRERPLKSGKGRMAIFSLEDQSGLVEVVCYSREFEEYEATLTSGEPLLVSATVKFEGDGESRVPRLQMKSAVTLPALRTQKTTQMHLHLHADRLGGEQVQRLKEILLQHVGDCRTYVHLSIPHRSSTRLVLSERYSVSPTDDLLLKLESLFGERVAVLR